MKGHWILLLLKKFELWQDHENDIEYYYYLGRNTVQKFTNDTPFTMVDRIVRRLCGYIS